MSFLPDCVDNNMEKMTLLEPITVSHVDGRLIRVPGIVWSQTIADTPWKFFVEDRKIDEGLKLSITCSGSSDDSWKLKVSRMLLDFEYNGQINTKSIGEREFNVADDKTEIFLTRAEISDLIGTVSGRGKKKLKVSMTVEWTEHVGMENFRSIRYDFRRRTDNSSMVIAIGDERFFVNLGFLAQISNYFSDIRRNIDSREKDDATGLHLLKLDDVEASDFEEILKLFYPFDHLSEMITSENVEALSKLSDKFKSLLMQRYCADEMIGMPDICAAKLLAICEKYNMEWNVEELINSLSKEQMKTMIITPEFQTLSQRTMKLLVIRLASNDNVKNVHTATSASNSGSSHSFSTVVDSGSESNSDI